MRAAADLIYNSESIVLLCGAGMGVDSGISTFRGRNAPEDGAPSPYVMSKYSTHLMDPHLFWGYQLQRAKSFIHSEPHHGYALLREMMNGKRSAIFTSNIDSHCYRVFGDEIPLVECHGSIRWMQSKSEGPLWPPTEQDMSIEVDETTGRAKQLPKSPDANILARFNILYIGDVGFCRINLDKQEAAFNQALSAMKKTVIIEIGAGTGIPTVRRKSGELSRKLNAPVIRINLDQSGLNIPYVDNLPPRDDHVSIGGCGAKEALEHIYAEWIGKK